MSDDGYRLEIIGGSLIVTPAPTARHQLVVGQLLAVLHAARASATAVLTAPHDWKLPDGAACSPISSLSSVTSSTLTAPCVGAPAAGRGGPVALQPRADRAVKRALYVRLGVPAYWLIDPAVPSLVSLRLVAGRYVVEAELAGTSVFQSDWPFAVRIVPSELAG